MQHDLAELRMRSRHMGVQYRIPKRMVKRENVETLSTQLMEGS
jgi:hypothetical protein